MKNIPKKQFVGWMLMLLLCISSSAFAQSPKKVTGRVMDCLLYTSGLLLCTWPKGGMLSLPFVYSNEVWTGIEYQVASHLMMKGEVEKGLDLSLIHI